MALSRPESLGGYVLVAVGGPVGALVAVAVLLPLALLAVELVASVVVEVVRVVGTSHLTS